MDHTKTIMEYYDSDPEKEWNRLEGFRFEFEITKVMLERHMRPGSVLDIGGGTGRYSIYLASLGYDVTMVDLSQENVDFALRKAKESGLTIKAYQGDARDLSKLHLEEYDNILLMGPLYHLNLEEDRAKCVKEAKKHLKEDGVLFASFISLTGGINYYLSECPLEMIYETEIGLFDCMEMDKSWYGPAFTYATFIEPDEIEPFFEKSGFKKITVFAQEGITAPRLKDLEAADMDVKKFYLDLSLRLCEKPKYFAYTAHIMYIGKSV